MLDFRVCFAGDPELQDSCSAVSDLSGYRFHYFPVIQKYHSFYIAIVDVILDLTAVACAKCRDFRGVLNELGDERAKLLYIRPVREVKYLCPLTNSIFMQTIHELIKSMLD